IRVDADSGDRRDARVARVGPHGFRAERGDLAGRVLPFERRQVAAADRQLERPDLRVLLDAPLGELGRAPFDCDLVDRADARQALLQRKLESTWKGRRLRHTASLAGAGPPAAGPGSSSVDCYGMKSRSSGRLDGAVSKYGAKPSG